MLARIALRMATVAALRGRTLAGDNVLDNQITALDADADGNLRTDQQKPFISVYTDAGRTEQAGPRMLHEAGSVDLVIEVGIAASMIARDDNGERIVVAGIPASDDAFEFWLDLVCRQIADALADPDDEWADIWRGLSCRITRVERGRTSSAEGTRIAAQQIRITLDLIEDPIRGEALEEGTPLAAFLAKMETVTVANPEHDPQDPQSPAAVTHPVIAAKLALMRERIDGANTPWQDVQRRLGLTGTEMQALGLGVDDVPDEVEITVEGTAPVVTKETPP